MPRATSAEDIKEYALANGISIQHAARSLRRQELLRKLNKAETVEDLKPLIRYLLAVEEDI